MYKKTSINKKIINDGRLAKKEKNVTFCEKNKLYLYVIMIKRGALCQIKKY